MATTKVILADKIDGLGAEADIVNVKAGFARNFLVPQGKAYEATKANLRHTEALQAKRAAREAAELQSAEQTAQKLSKTKLSLELATGQGGKAFGSITTQDLAKALAEKGIELDRHLIQLDKPIKGTGSFDIEVKLHADVLGLIKLKVTTPEEAEEATANGSQ
ncbi:MAG: 50S ribosomal protein L9 [Verrucomicrobiota bacterium]